MSDEDKDMAETPAEPATKKAPAKKAAAKKAPEAGEARAAKKPAAKKEPEAKESKAKQAETGTDEPQAKAEKKPAAKKEPEQKPAETKAETKATEAAQAEAKPAPKRVSPKAPRRRVVRAHARYVRTSARKARMVSSHLPGKTVGEARAMLEFTPREVARDWSKLLESAVANAEHNHELLEEDLIVREAYADEGPTIKRFRPRAMGRATPIHKRTSHLTITLTTGS
jgi:ribosomal protein L22